MPATKLISDSQWTVNNESLHGHMNTETFLRNLPTHLRAMWRLIPSISVT